MTENLLTYLLHSFLVMFIHGHRGGRASKTPPLEGKISLTPPLPQSVASMHTPPLKFKNLRKKIATPPLEFTSIVLEKSPLPLKNPVR